MFGERELLDVADRVPIRETPPKVSLYSSGCLIAVFRVLGQKL